MILSIVIPTHVERTREFLSPLIASLHTQVGDSPQVEILALTDNGRMSIGRKMGILTRMARGSFMSAIGDDDSVHENYVETLLGAIDENPEVDVISFDHDYYHDGEFRARISEELGNGYRDDHEGRVLIRPASSKCVVRTSVAKKFNYPESWHGEDRAFADWLATNATGGVHIPRVLYYYFYRGENKHWRRKQEAIGRASA